MTRTQSAASIGRPNAFTMTDLLVLVALLSLLAALVVARQATTREKAKSAQCLANLGKVNHAVLQFSGDNNQHLPGLLPDENRSLWWWYKEQVKRYVGLAGESSDKDAVFACPSDRGYSDATPFHHSPRFDFSSYVYNGVTLPGMPHVAGLPLSAVNQPKRTLLTMEWTAHAPLSWHQSRTGRNNAPFYCDAVSVVAYVDGHAASTRIYYDGYNAAYTQDPITGYDYQYSPK